MFVVQERAYSTHTIWWWVLTLIAERKRMLLGFIHIYAVNLNGRHDYYSWCLPSFILVCRCKVPCTNMVFDWLVLKHFQHISCVKLMFGLIFGWEWWGLSNLLASFINSSFMLGTLSPNENIHFIL